MYIDIKPNTLSNLINGVNIILYSVVLSNIVLPSVINEPKFI